MDERLYEQMYDLELNHWWFAARRMIILDQIEQLLGDRRLDRILDAGCGTGGLFKFLERYGKVYGLDSSELSIKFCKQRGSWEVYMGSLNSDIPFERESFDLILALDVLEHIDDDFKAIKSIYDLLKKNGIFLCTVPAYSFLWGFHDVIHHHFRRYTRNELKKKLINAGFKIKKISYYNTVLFPLIAFVRLFRRLVGVSNPSSDAMMPSFVTNVVLLKCFSFEKYLLRHVNMPFGVSILAVSEK